MRSLIIILVTLVFLLYFKHYVSPTKQFNIVQLPLCKVDPSFLFEKNPIIINEPIMSPLHLTDTLFKYLYVKKVQSAECTPHTFIQIRSRYAIIYPRHRDDSIKIVHPKKSRYLKKGTEEALKHIDYVEVILRKRQVIILPMYWWYQVDNPNFGCIDLDDTFSFLSKQF